MNHALVIILSVLATLSYSQGIDLPNIELPPLPPVNVADADFLGLLRSPSSSHSFSSSDTFSISSGGETSGDGVSGSDQPTNTGSDVYVTSSGGFSSGDGISNGEEFTGSDSQVDSSSDYYDTSGDGVSNGERDTGSDPDLESSGGVTSGDGISGGELPRSSTRYEPCGRRGRRGRRCTTTTTPPPPPSNNKFMEELAKFAATANEFLDVKNAAIGTIQWGLPPAESDQRVKRNPYYHPSMPNNYKPMSTRSGPVDVVQFEKDMIYGA